MKGYDEATYGERIANVYDTWIGAPAPETDAAVRFLAEVAGSGPVLELGIGTGRIALPLAARGIDVHGIDASPAMVERLQAKPGAELSVALGDFANVDVQATTYSLIFVVFNTLFALPSQEDQLRCFRNVAAHLTPSGVFVVEAFVPDLTRFTRQQEVSTTVVESDQVRLDVSLHDPVLQQVRSQHVVITSAGAALYPVVVRYAWPTELDLMARLAGLRLSERWGGWNREPFTAHSQSHVSVYERLA
ncbi:MAG: methyltransferase domain-containing protein [Chloroflexi bacterium]|nr:methyltransferase domain-containing protein [Chloroflexota bacterium]